MTKAAWRDAWSIRTRIASSVTSATTVRLGGLPGRLAQRDTGRLGSASMTVTLAPCPASSVARTTAEVDFPAPPLGLAKTGDNDFFHLRPAGRRACGARAHRDGAPGAHQSCSSR